MEIKLIMVTKKFEWNLLDIDYNESSKAYKQYILECEKVNNKINKRKLFETKNEEIAHSLTFSESKD